jgi:transcriptional regulator with XRE-family HTH domain
MDINKRISQAIVKGRTLRKLSQGQLANELGISPSTVSKWETLDKAPAGETLIKLIQILGIYNDIFPVKRMCAETLLRFLREEFTVTQNTFEMGKFIELDQSTLNIGIPQHQPLQVKKFKIDEDCLMVVNGKTKLSIAYPEIIFFKIEKTW